MKIISLLISLSIIALQSKASDDTIDSLYNRLVREGADSIIVYHQMESPIRTQGIITWKKSGQLFATVFKTESGRLFSLKNSIKSEMKLKEARQLYFQNEVSMPDTLPRSKVNFTEEFSISIHSLHNSVERKHQINSFQVITSQRSPYAIVNVAKIFNDILLRER